MTMANSKVLYPNAIYFMRALSETKCCEQTKISQAKTEKVILGFPEDDIEYTMGVMTKNLIRHLPILENEKIRRHHFTR